MLRGAAWEVPKVLTSFFSGVVAGCAWSWSTGCASGECVQHCPGLGVLLVPRTGPAHPSSTCTVDGSRAAVAPGVAQLFSAEEQRRSWEKSSKGQQRARLHL